MWDVSVRMIAVSDQGYVLCGGLVCRELTDCAAELSYQVGRHGPAQCQVQIELQFQHHGSKLVFIGSFIQMSFRKSVVLRVGSLKMCGCTGTQ